MRAAVDVPVLLIIFNRPDKTAAAVAALREAKPRRLFVAADGPRSDVPGEAARCEASRQELAQIDWACDVQTLFRGENLGCKRGPESAISWFFSHVTEGVILEDDCIPTEDFLPFCAELLARFEADDRVMMIGGHNLLGRWQGTGSSYVFSRTLPTWGWATWRRAWRHYDPEMTGWATRPGRAAVHAQLPAAAYRMARRDFDSVASGQLDAWDYAWWFAMLRAGGLAVVPAGNMVTNVGFGPDATHTKNVFSPDARVPTAPVRAPLVHPHAVGPDIDFETAEHRLRFPLKRRFMAALPTPVRAGIRSAAYRVLARGGRA